MYSHTVHACVWYGQQVLTEDCTIIPRWSLILRTISIKFIGSSTSIVFMAVSTAMRTPVLPTPALHKIQKTTCLKIHANYMQTYAQVCMHVQKTTRLKLHANYMQTYAQVCMYARKITCLKLHANYMQTYAKVSLCMHAQKTTRLKLHANYMQTYVQVCMHAQKTTCLKLHVNIYTSVYACT